MNEFICEWGEHSLGSLDGANGIPIPRGNNSSIFLHPNFNEQYIGLNSGSSPSPHMIVPPNSLNQDTFGQMTTLRDMQRTSVSPYFSNDSPSGGQSSQFDAEMEIKMEPLDEMIDIGVSESQIQKSGEDNLLDNVNFEDLLMTDDMDSTTCLDPQHSSPAAMATVHPDEVFGLMRTNLSQIPVSQTITLSNFLPVKSEVLNYEFTGSSCPSGMVSKESNRFHPIVGSLNLQSTLNSGNQVHSVTKVGSFGSIDYNAAQSDLSPQEPHQRNSDYSSGSGHSELQYTQLEPVSNTSALHDLLVNSPSTSQSVHSHISPSSNLSPLSPVPDHTLQDVPIGQSVPGMQSFLTNNLSNFSSRLSSSAPVNNFPLDQIWQRREPRQHLLSTGSLAEEIGGSTSSLSTGGGILSPLSYDFSIDEGIDSDSDAERFNSDSDNESILSEDFAGLSSQGSKKERHFWQYNVQAKGPKGQRVNITQKETNPYNLAKLTDPVFSPLCSVQGIKHSGKARRGDGNDLTPNPKKLVNIGIELNKLNKKINEMTPVSELPSTIRSKSRKEKNKLASRACRLKKKAQHEANKIKLFGLEQEHKGTLTSIREVRERLAKKVDLLKASADPHDAPHLQTVITADIEQSFKNRTRPMIAGQTTDFVNRVIENCRTGDPSGGLGDLNETLNKKIQLANDHVHPNYNNQLYT